MISLSRFLVRFCGFHRTTTAKGRLVRFNINREDGVIFLEGRCIVRILVCDGGLGKVILLLAMNKCKELKETERQHTYGKLATIFGDSVEWLLVTSVSCP